MKKVKKVKKVVVLVVMILTCLFTSSCYSEADVTAAENKGYEAGYRDGYKHGYKEAAEAPKELKRPPTGSILSGREYDESEITVTADSSCDYVVSLKSYWQYDYITFYVRAGTTVTVGVPAESLRVYFASGTKWYGYGEGLMFGKETVYSKDDDLLDFSEYSWEYTLYPVTDGNFTETPSDEGEFFF